MYNNAQSNINHITNGEINIKNHVNNINNIKHNNGNNINNNINNNGMDDEVSNSMVMDMNNFVPQNNNNNYSMNIIDKCISIMCRFRNT